MAASLALAALPPAVEAAGVPAVSPEQAGAMSRAGEWLKRGQGRAALSELASLESALAGLPAFDMQFGQAALMADRPTQAAFAFERCLAVEPRNGLCRLGLARAHISLSEKASAREELEFIARSAPPPEVQDAVAQSLGVLSGVKDASQDERLAAYLEVGAGYSSNINSATSASTMALPAFGGAVFGLSRDGRRRGSGFNRAIASLGYSTPLATDWRFLLDARIDGAANWQTGRYNTLASDVSAGVARKSGKHQFIARLQAQNYALGGRSYRNLIGVLGQYAYSVSDRSELSGFAQASRLNYRDDGQRDAMRYTLGASWSQALADDRAVVYASLYGGRESTIRGGAPASYGHHFTGLRLGGMYMLTPRLKLEAGFGAERRRYGGQDWLFEKQRRETVYDGFAGLDYAVSRKLSLRPQYRYTGSSSSIPLRDHQRHIISVNLRYELF